MTTLEQAEKLDNILNLYLESGNNGVRYTDINNIYPGIHANEISYYLMQKEMLANIHSQVQPHHTNYKISAQGILHLDAGGFSEQIRYRNKMDSYVIQSTKLSEDTVELSKTGLKLENDTLRISRIALIIL